MKPSLLVLAAGMGSRYGGLKQIDPMGPNGETLLDYSLTDAAKAGFEKVVFVIRRDFADQFREAVGERYADRLEIAYAFQELTDLPGDFHPPEGRTKPWGTAHAIRAARELISDPFVAINADDYYGADAFQRISKEMAEFGDHPGEMATVGYPIGATLSENGVVNRGVCVVENGLLKAVEEHTEIALDSEGVIRGKNLRGDLVSIPENALVSLNFWAFSTNFYEPLEAHFQAFLSEYGGELKSECYIPTVVDQMINDQLGWCKVLPTTGQWFGVTYPEDKPAVQARLAKLASQQ